MAPGAATTSWKIWKGYVDTPEGQMHYHRCGAADANPLILLHQWPEGATQWDLMLPVLAAKGFLAIALDMPMFGQSYTPREEPDMGGFAEGVLAGVQALGYQGPMDYVGHHSGAGVAMWLAVNRANCVKRLVLWGVPVLTPELARQFKDEPAPVFDDDGEKIAAAWKGTRQAMPSLSTDQALTVLIGRLRMKEDAVWMHHALAETDFEELATQVQQPVLCLASDKEILGPNTRKCASLFPNAIYMDIPGAVTCVANSHPHEFVQAITQFLA